nr:hypothetical protein [Bifidobacterium avesanii]
MNIVEITRKQQKPQKNPKPQNNNSTPPSRKILPRCLVEADNHGMGVAKSANPSALTSIAMQLAPDPITESTSRLFLPRHQLTEKPSITDLRSRYAPTALSTK